MGWHQFRYIFNKEVENAMRYSIKEALRRQVRERGWGTSDDIVNDAVESFRRKMDKHTGVNQQIRDTPTINQREE